MKFHRMHSVVELMKALECGFALGILKTNVPTHYWAWLRLLPDSDTWKIDCGKCTDNNFPSLTSDLIRYPWRWHIGVITGGYGDKRYHGDFEVTIEDTYTWV